MWFYKKFLLVFSLFVILSILISCGFKPLYNQFEGKKEITGMLRIPKLTGQEGFHVREELIRNLGDPLQSKYLLELKIETKKINEVITPSNEITSYRLIMSAEYSIRNEYGVTMLPTQESTVRTGFSSASNSTGYMTQVAEEAAKKRLALKIAREISTRLLILSEKWLQ